MTMGKILFWLMNELLITENPSFLSIYFFKCAYAKTMVGKKMLFGLNWAEIWFV